jgi:predicted metal-dependent enzyme (double-stranded beta helix superfamily)
MQTQELNGKFGRFIERMNDLVDNTGDEARLLESGGEYLAELIAEDNWLPESCTAPHPEYYQQYLLYGDPQERFSVVSFVWGPGQETPVHDHTVWGLIGMLRGGEIETSYEVKNDQLVAGEQHSLHPGDVGKVSPTIGDVHQVANAFEDQVSISIHVYGADIGKVKRHVFTETDETKEFISGYTNTELPDFAA